MKSFQDNLIITSLATSSICKSFTKPHETISVPKSGSMIWDKAFSTSSFATSTDIGDLSAERRISQIGLKMDHISTSTD